MKKQTHWIIALLLIIVFLIPGGIWLQQSGDIRLYFSNAVPKGQLLYVLSKLTGLYAFFLFMLHLLFSLGCRYQIIALPWRGTLHKISGSIVLLLSLMHLLLFFSAVSLRQESLALGLFLPNFSDYYHSHVSFGLIGFLGLVAVMIAGIIRTVRKSHYAPIVHRIYYISVGLIYLHVLAIGTESQSDIGKALYINLGILFLTLLLLIHFKQSKIKGETL